MKGELVSSEQAAPLANFRNLTLAEALVAEAAYSEQAKDNCARAYARCGSLIQVSLDTGAPLPLLRYWSQQQWWQDAVSFLEQDKELSTDSRVVRLMDDALAVLTDRLQHGDTVILSDGTPVYRPVSARDTATVLSTMLEHRRAIRRKVESATAEQRNSTLARLQSRLEAIGSALGLPQEALPHDHD